MKTKQANSLTYTGLGFPIELHDVTLYEIDGDWHPKIDVKKLANLAIKEMITQKERFSGNQVKFIRAYFSMTLRQFAKEAVHVSHTAINKWEKHGEKVTSMDINIEKILRLFLYEKLCTNTTKQKNAFYNYYLAIKNISLSKNPGLLKLSLC